MIHLNNNLTKALDNELLAKFISTAKIRYGVIKIGVVGENADVFRNVIEKYNDSRGNSYEKIDIYNLEFEFWSTETFTKNKYYCQSYLQPNRLPCNNEGAFSYALKTLIEMKKLAIQNRHPISVETYIGWTLPNQANALSKTIDKVRIHGYVNDNTYLIPYVENRLKQFLKEDTNVEISIILSGESKFMKEWFSSNSLDKTEKLFFKNLSIKNPSRKRVTGFTYFNYSELTK